MEPMTLGSPVGSPAQSPITPGAQSAYLPGFLLGDNNMHSRVGVASPDTSRFVPSPGIHSPSSSLNYGSPDYRTNRQKAMFGTPASPSNVPQINSENQVGGPPTRGLFDSLETSQLISSHTSSLNQSHMKNQSRIISGNMNTTLIDSPTSPVNNNSESSQGLLQWVTVFGFPPSALNAVLAHISSRVRIIDKHQAPHPQSNWIHLKCTSEQETQRALSCNGNIVSGSLMIGVIPCTDEGVILGADKENRFKLNNSMRLFTSPVKAGQGLANTPMKTPVRIQNARPLVTGYNQSLSPQSVRQPENIPHKTTGLVSKAMEYVFGW